MNKPGHLLTDEEIKSFLNTGTYHEYLVRAAERIALRSRREGWDEGFAEAARFTQAHDAGCVNPYREEEADD